MNVKRILRIVAVFVGVFIVANLLHTSIFGNLPLGVVTPNVLLLVTASFGFMQGTGYGMIMGFICGIMMDCYYPEYFGLNCLIYLFIGYLNGLFSRYFYGDDIRLPLLLVGISDFFYGFLVYMFLFLVRQRFDLGFYLINIIIPEAVYTMVVSLILYFPILKVLRWAGGNHGRGRTLV